VRHSQAKALTAKALSAKSMEAFWLIYETKSGLELPFNWASQFKQMRRQSLRIDPKIYTIIQELKSHGKKVALLSNVPASRAKDIRKLGLYKPFHPAILSCDIGVEKPNKKAFRVLLKKLGNVDPNRCFFIDDKIENVNAALRLGIQAVQYESPKKLRWQLALRNILPPKKAY
jgi:putative hydrolase of the HAD superfamily